MSGEILEDLQIKGGLVNAVIPLTGANPNCIVVRFVGKNGREVDGVGFRVIGNFALLEILLGTSDKVV